jgi:hypothetical protein
MSAFIFVALVVGACGPDRGCVTPNLGLSHEPLQFALALGFGLYTLHALIIAMETARFINLTSTTEKAEGPRDSP